MDAADRTVTLRDYWRVIVRRKWIVATAVSMALCASVLMSALQEPIYEGEAQMLLEPRSGNAVFQQSQELAVQNLDRAIQTEIQVLEGQLVRTRVRDDLGLGSLPPEVNATAIGSTDVVSVRVRSADPAVARTLADAYVTAYTSTRREHAVDDLLSAGRELEVKISELQGQVDGIDASIAAEPQRERAAMASALAAQRQALINQEATFKERLAQLQVDAALTTGGASVVRSAETPDEPVVPNPFRDVALAAAIGLVLGLAAAFLIDHLDDSLRAATDLEELGGPPVLAAVPVEPPPDHRPIAISEPHAFAVEIFRGLRTNIQFLGLDAPLRIIQVTSGLPGEGKTTTASNLAVVLVQAGHRVVLVDADLRKPQLHETFAVPATPGLIEILLGELIELVINHLDHGLDLVTAGGVPPNPSEMLSSTRIATLLSDLAERFDYVIVDSAPILPVTDSIALSRAVDGVLVVAQAGRTSRRHVAETLVRLERVGAPVLGLILNQATTRRGDTGVYGYGYRYPATAPVDGAAARRDPKVSAIGDSR